MPANPNQLSIRQPEQQEVAIGLAASQLVLNQEIAKQPDALSDIKNIAEMLTKDSPELPDPENADVVIKGFSANVSVAASYNPKRFTNAEILTHYDNNGNFKWAEFSLATKNKDDTTDYDVYYDNTDSGRVLQFSKREKALQPGIENLEGMTKFNFDKDAQAAEDAQELSRLLQGMATARTTEPN